VDMRLSTTGRPTTQRNVAHPRAGISLIEAAIVLIALYALLGTGIGSACGSVLLGMFSGLMIGVFAVAAILLISGSARAAEKRLVDARAQMQAR
jgi:hypothetical protein